MKAAFLILPSLLLSAAAKSRDVKSEIAEAGRKLASAFNRGDAAAVSLLYSSSARVLPPGMGQIEGRESIRAFYQDEVEKGKKLSAAKDVSVVRHGDLVYEVGRGALQILHSPVPLAKLGRKYLRIWKFTRSAWKIEVDIWNENSDDAGSAKLRPTAPDVAGESGRDSATSRAANSTDPVKPALEYPQLSVRHALVLDDASGD
jgi:ketosteroid isomerase-like protein